MGNESRNYKTPSEKSNKTTQRKPRGKKKTREEQLALAREDWKRRWAEGRVKPLTEEQKAKKRVFALNWHAKKREEREELKKMQAEDRAEISGSTSLPVPPPNTSVSSLSSIYSVLPPSAYQPLHVPPPSAYESIHVPPPSTHESRPVPPPSAYESIPVPQPNYYPPFGPPNYPPPPIPTDEEIAEDTLNAMQEDQKAASIFYKMLNGPKAKTNDEHYDDIDAVELLTKIRNKKGGKKRMSNKNKSKKNRKSKKNKK